MWYRHFFVRNGGILLFEDTYMPPPVGPPTSCLSFRFGWLNEPEGTLERETD